MDIANLNFLKKNDAPAKEKNNSVVKVCANKGASIFCCRRGRSYGTIKAYL